MQPLGRASVQQQPIFFRNGEWGINGVKLRDSAPEGVQYGRPITFPHDFNRPLARPRAEPTDD